MAYRGITTTLPIGLTGLNGSLNIGDLVASDLIEADGVLVEGGTLRKEPGALKLNTSDLDGDIIAGINWSPIGDVRRDYVVVQYSASNVEVMRDTGTGAFGTEIATALSADDAGDKPNPLWIPAGGEAVGATRKLFLVSPDLAVRYINGDDTSFTAATMAADWTTDGERPSFGVVHRGRLWLGGNNSDPHRLYATASSDHTDWSTPTTLSVYPGEGERLVGAVSFRGYLYVFKYPAGIYQIDTSSSTVGDWNARKISGAVGAVSQGTILEILNDVLFLDHAGNFHLLSAVDTEGDVSASNISAQKSMDDFFRRTIDLDRLRRAAGVWDWTRRHALFGLSQAGSTTNDIKIVVDFSDPRQGIRWFTSTRDVTQSLWMRPDSEGGQVRPVYGDDAGFIRLLNQTDRTKDGAFYGMNVLSAPMDFSFIDDRLTDRIKTSQFLDVTYQPVDDTGFTLSVLWDGSVTATVIIEPSQAGAALGSFTLGTDSLGGESGDISTLLSRRRRVVGSGRRMQVRVEEDGSSADVQIVRLRMGIKSLVERDVEIG